MPHDLGRPHQVRFALKYMLDNESMGIRDYEKMCRGVNRKTLQRDLKEMIEKGIVVTEGKTSSLVYRVKGVGYGAR